MKRMFLGLLVGLTAAGAVLVLSEQRVASAAQNAAAENTGKSAPKKIQRNESAVLGSIRAVVGAEVAYFAANNKYTTLDRLVAEKFLADDFVKQLKKTGYGLHMSTTDTTFSCTASPEKPGETGQRYFFVDESGIIRHALSKAEANASAEPLSAK